MAERPRIVVVGGGFAGYHAVRTLQEYADEFEIVVVNQTDYFLYLPLLPEVATGLLEPRRICVPLRSWPGRVTVQLGVVDVIDTAARRVGWVDPEGRRGELTYDRLVLAVGSVNKLLPIPGVAENAHGMRGLAEALFLRDHLTRQIELAGLTDDPAERDARCTFVVVGGGYTGTETAAQGQLFTARLARDSAALRDQRIRWLLLDTAPRLLPELDPRLSATSHRVLTGRGVEVRTGQSVTVAGPGGITLTTGEEIATRTLVWCVGVRPDPVVAGLGLPVDRGRLVVDTSLRVPTLPDVFACGDCAAVPDLTRPGEITGMTAQHAMRQGHRVALNVVASLRGDRTRDYKHHDLGFLVDLGGTQAAANPLRVPLSGFAAKVVTRSYHLFALPGNRLRTATDWAINAVEAPSSVRLDLVRADDAALVVPTDVGPADADPNRN